MPHGDVDEFRSGIVGCCFVLRHKDMIIAREPSSY
jgi:hypothetical protein